MTKQQMKWNSEQQAYFGITSDGKQISVEADEMAESARDAGVDIGELSGLSVFGTPQAGSAEAELLDPDTWQTCIGANQNVSYVE